MKFTDKKYCTHCTPSMLHEIEYNVDRDACDTLPICVNLRNIHINVKLEEK